MSLEERLETSLADLNLDTMLLPKGVTTTYVPQDKIRRSR